jgi:glutaredoxin
MKQSIASLKYPTIKIYGETWCPYCKLSKILAKKINPKFDPKKDFISGKTSVQLKKLLKLKSTPKTIPLILVNKKYIGGYSNLQNLFN